MYEGEREGEREKGTYELTVRRANALYVRGTAQTPKRTRNANETRRMHAFADDEREG